MKTKRTIILAGLIALLTTAFVLSCDNPIGLGAMLDLDGPDVRIDSPTPRKTVSSQFTIDGKVSDKSDIDRMVIKAEKNRVAFPKQWRYSKEGWEVSENSGASWTAFSGTWDGKVNNASWSVPLDMNIDGALPADGEYLFSVQAWDIGDFSDDKSYKTIVLIIDNLKPVVEVSNPRLYSRNIEWNDSASAFEPKPAFLPSESLTTEAQELQGLHADSTDNARFDPANIGKFLTQDFKLQWEIEEANDIWSVELRFYKHNTVIDEDEATLLNNDSYIFSYKKNLPPPLGDPNLLPRPNGSVQVPALHSAARTEATSDGGSWELKNPLLGPNEKTTIQVVSICYDMAGYVNEEKVLGWFIYWKEAGEPWITFTDGMEKPDNYYGQNIGDIQEDIFMIYPGRDIKATAFQAHGVGGVKYSVYKCGDAGTLTAPNKTTNVIVEDEWLYNSPPPGGSSLSTIWSWSFAPPPQTGYYVVEAYAYGSKDGNIDLGNESVLYTALFRVQDIMFPQFGEILPTASEPLFMSIEDGKITVSGTVTDATRVANIYMVWINPQSRNYAAMSQLQYYRDKDYTGWQQAAEVPLDGSAVETITNSTYDGAAPNRLWNIRPKLAGTDPSTQRQIYEFSAEIDLYDNLNIGKTYIDDKGNEKTNYLASQIFLLRAENPDKKCHIITYAPQGDTLAPEIEIKRAVITKNNVTVATCIPGQFTEPVPKFANGDIITIYGEWKEDSIRYLDFNTYLKPNFEFSLNGEVLEEGQAGIAITRAIAYTDTTATGTFEIKVTLGENNRINIGYLRDTFMVNVKVSDMGGNPAEHAGSWLVASDALSFLRISSEASDDTYKTGDIIDIYLEFSKPVILNPSASADPVLLLSSTGSGATAIATYKSGQTVENTRQYFTYTVGSNHTAVSPNYLNVTGLQGGDTGYANANYRFMWQHTPANGATEYVRLTTNTTNPANGARPLPTAATDIQSLIKAKNISIDTAAPTVSSVAATAGRHPEGAEVYITVTFNENVQIGTTNLPYLTLTNGNGNNGRTAYASADDISVTRNIIRFKYVVQAGDTTGTNQLTVTGFGGTITDIAGNAFGSIGTRTLTGVYLDTIQPTQPTIQIVNNSNEQINNTVNSGTVNGTSNTSSAGNWTPSTVIPPVNTSAIALSNVYNDVVKLQVTTIGSFNTDYSKLEYSTNDGKDWVQFNNVVTGTTIYRIELPMPGSYIVTARQTDAAGNVSNWTRPISLTWDKGTIISRIETAAAAGTYTNRATPAPARQDTIPITTHFRKPVMFSATPTLTLNARNTPTGTGGTQATATATSAILPNGTPAGSVTGVSVSSITFTYTVGANDNTAENTALAVMAFNLNSGNATDAGNVQVNTYVTPLPAVTNFGKNIVIQTGPLALVTTPAQPVTSGITAANDVASGNITFTFNRAISKGSAGDVTVVQDTSGYRLPAVLTEAQYSRYRNIANFNSFYTRGTNGFSGSAPDTSTKYVLNYTESAVVDPSNAGGATNIQRMAYDFHAAENVTLAVTSQDISVSGSTLTISLTGSNALQVLGAQHTITIPANIVQDSLGYSWPASVQTYTYTTPGINGPFARVNKQTNTDTINGYGYPNFTAPTNQTGSTSQPWLVPAYVLETTARLDCRTPNSVVRYNIAEGTHTATGVTTTAAGTGDGNWRNTSADTAVAIPAQGNITTASDLYNTFSSTFTVGNTNEQGYVGRISARSYRSDSTNESTSSAIYDEVAYRSVVTVELTGNARAQYGQLLASGDQLWIHGGDAKSSSSVPGYPLTWDVPTTAGTRAGIRLMSKISTGDYHYTRDPGDNTANSNSASQWRWVSWEINVPTYFEIVLGRGVNASNAPDTTAQPSAQEAWWYGPRVWAPQRGGWAARDTYPLNPGRHRWVRMNESSFTPGGVTNFASSWQTRPYLAAP